MKLDPSSITILPERQRQDLGDLEDLKPSIARYGLFHPIVVRKDSEGRPILVAGERRLRAWLEVRADDPIPCTLFSDLSEFDQELIELEENTHRKDLSWQERVLAIARLDKLLRASEPEWTQEKTAERCGLTRRHIGRVLQIADFAEVEAVWNSPTMAVASALADRRIQREIDRQSAGIAAAVSAPEPIVDLEDSESDEPAGMAPDMKTPAIPFSVINADFLEWAASYHGEPFTFIHCDFPYGMNYHKSDQAHQASSSYTAYSDDPEVFNKLFACLDEHCDRLIAPVAHMIFWHKAGQSHKIAQRILATDRGWQVFLVPLIWFRSDNRGIAADVNRQPRHVYETALLCSRGDRRTFKLVSDVKDSPTSRDVHTSHKPISVLSHFFQMTVDEHTSVLDPTCGSGSALQAALGLGARRIVGVEQNQDYCEIAETGLRRAWNLKEANKLLEATNG